MFFVFPHIQTHIVLPGQILLRPQFIPNSLVDSGSATRPLDISRVQTAHIGLVHSDSVLKGIFLWTGQYLLVLDLVLVPGAVVTTTRVHEILLTSWDLGWIFLWFAIVPGSIWEITLFVERTGFVVG